MSKKVLVLFGILDILFIEKLFNITLKCFQHNIFFIDVLGILFSSLVILTGILLIKNNRIGFILSYVEFPIRLTIGYFSFGFFLWFVNFVEYGDSLRWTIIFSVLETIRLIITIIIHRKELANARALTSM